MTTPFLTSNYGKRLGSVMHARRPSVAFLGESHGIRMAGVFQYACARYYHADITMDTRTYANGGQMFAVGGTQTDHLVATQIPQFVLRPADIGVIVSGYNDLTGGSLTLTQTKANIQSAMTSMFAAGALWIVLCGQTPTGGGHGVAAQQLNNWMRNLAANSPFIFFIDVSGILADPTAASPNFLYRGPATGAFGSFTTDGTHWSGTAKRLLAPLVVPILQLVAPERLPRHRINTGIYDPAAAPYADILGDAGNCLGTSGIGYAFTFDPGVPGTGATDRLSTTSNGLSGGALANSIVTDATDGHRMLRITPSGTLGAGAYGNANVNYNPNANANLNNSDNTRVCTVEAEIRLNGVTGFVEPFIRLNNDNTLVTTPLAEATYDTSAGYPNTTTETLFLYTTFPIPVPGAASNPFFTLVLAFRDSVTLAGTIDIGRMSATLLQ
jgi:hypothetical protein